MIWSSDLSDRPEFSDYTYGLGSCLNEKYELVTPLWGSVPLEEVSSFVYLIISEPAVGSNLLGQVGVINLLINGFVGRPIVFSVAPNFGPFYFSDLINDQMGVVETARNQEFNTNCDKLVGGWISDRDDSSRPIRI